MGIKPKIFLYMIAFCIILLVVLWLFQTVLLESFYKSIKQREVENVATTISAAIISGEDWQSTVLQRGDIYVELYELNGDTQTVAGNHPEGMYPTLNEEEKLALYEEVVANGGFISRRQVVNIFDGINRALQEGQSSPIQDIIPPMQSSSLIESNTTTPARTSGGLGPFLTDPREEREGILYATLVDTAEGERLLIISAEITPVNATIQTLRVQLVYISIFVLLLGIGLALLISRIVAQPLTSLTRQAKHLADEEYDVRFNAAGYREVTQLSDTLNIAASELGKTEALRRELVANVSHDLRTPLTLITGYAEMMRDIPGEATGENMQVIIDESRRLTALVNELVEYSRLESGTGEICIDKINLTAEARNIIERFNKLGAAEGLVIQFHYTEDLWVMADAKRVAQVLYNFLSNATAHTGNDKTITVRQREKAGKAMIEVKDTGAGIAAEDLPYIWNRYYKTDGNRRTVTPGTGLGLSIAKAILDQHPQAAYGARNRKAGGSVFWFSLPVVDPPEE